MVFRRVFGKSFFYGSVDVNNIRFDVNKDVVDGVLIDEAESSLEGNGRKRRLMPMQVEVKWWRKALRRRWLRIFVLMFPIWLMILSL